MIVVLGLMVVIAVIVVGMAGVLTNHGSGHALNHGEKVKDAFSK
jgi:hypothetical protein